METTKAIKAFIRRQKRHRKSAWNRWGCATIEGIICTVAGLAFIGWSWAGLWFCYVMLTR